MLCRFSASKHTTMTGKRIAIILHNPQGSTGLIGELLTAAGHHLTIRCPLNGCPLPEAQDYDAAIVFGGKMSVNDCDTCHPSLHDELRWIRQSVDAGKPYLGICLGAQLLARAYGGNVTRHHEDYVEIGYYAVYPTVEGFLDIFADAPEKFFQWHNEGFTIPDGAVKLAASDLYPNQAFRIGKHAYGFQFHPEATATQIAHWHARDQEELAGPGAQTVPMQLRDLDTYTPHIRVWLHDFLNKWLHLQA